MLPLVKASFVMFPRVIKTMADLKNAITATYLFDLMIAVAMVLVMVLVANLIAYEPGRVDNSGKKRRVAFFLIAVLTLVACLGLDYWLYLSKIAVAAYVTKYLTTMAIASVVAVLAYFLIGFVLVKISRKGSKLESIFPKKD